MSIKTFLPLGFVTGGIALESIISLVSLSAVTPVGSPITREGGIAFLLFSAFLVNGLCGLSFCLGMFLRAKWAMLLGIVFISSGIIASILSFFLGASGTNVAITVILQCFLLYYLQSNATKTYLNALI